MHCSIRLVCNGKIWLLLGGFSIILTVGIKANGYATVGLCENRERMGPRGHWHGVQQSRSNRNWVPLCLGLECYQNGKTIWQELRDNLIFVVWIKIHIHFQVKAKVLGDTRKSTFIYHDFYFSIFCFWLKRQTYHLKLIETLITWLRQSLIHCKSLAGFCSVFNINWKCNL